MDLVINNNVGLIWVVDSNDRERLDESALEFQRTLKEDELRDTQVLVFCNKQGSLPPVSTLILSSVNMKSRSRALCRSHELSIFLFCDHDSSDLPNAMTVNEISDRLKPQEHTQQIYFQASCMTSGDGTSTSNDIL